MPASAASLPAEDAPGLPPACIVTATLSRIHDHRVYQTDHVLQHYEAHPETQVKKNREARLRDQTLYVQTMSKVVQQRPGRQAFRLPHLAHLLLVCLPLPRQCHLHLCSFGDPQAQSQHQASHWGCSLEHAFGTSSSVQCAAVPGSLQPLQK